MTADSRDIIVRPVISEKSFSQAERGKYTFVVLAKATKPQIRRAVEEIWGVRVNKVNTVQRHGKLVRRRAVQGKRADTCRAIVTLAPGEKIEMFEGA